MRKVVFVLFLILIILPIYFNIISAESINDSYLSINLISWPEEGGGLYYNYTSDDNETEDELPYQYNFTNSSSVDTCLLYIDNLTVASSKDDNNKTDFLNWWSDEEILIDSIEGDHTWQVYCNLSNGVSNFSELRTFESFDYLMIPPDVWLTWPNDNQIFNQEYTINLYFDYENTSTMTNCSGYVDNKLVFIMDLIKSNVINVTDNIVSNGEHTWSFSCTNIYNRKGESENRSFYRLNFNIIPPDLFLTYDLTSTNLTNIFGLNIWSEYEFGYIYYIDNVSLPNISLLNLINISQNRIFLNSTKLTMLNKNATLTLYDVTFSNPRILKDNVVITIPFIFENGTLSFNVSSFSEYRIEETPTTPPSSGSSGGGGGGSSGGSGGGSSSNKKINQTLNKSTSVVINNSLGDYTNLTNTNSEIPSNATISNPSRITGAITGVYNKVVSKWFYFILVIIVGMLVFFIIRRRIKSSPRIRYYSE